MLRVAPDSRLFPRRESHFRIKTFFFMAGFGRWVGFDRLYGCPKPFAHRYTIAPLADHGGAFANARCLSPTFSA